MSESKTAGELRELLDRIEDTNNSNAAGCMAVLWRMAPDLARRVIAAEKLVEALDGMIDRNGMHCIPDTQAQEGIDAALNAYREASK